MNKIAAILTGAIAVLQFTILYIEMFAWNSLGPKVFKTLSADLFEPTTAIAANQGLYNGFLGAGLLWAFFIKDPKWSVNVATCFLLFVGVAGIYGAITVSPTILFAQTLPPAIALGFMHLGKAKSAV